jgi:hypothetical protein
MDKKYISLNLLGDRYDYIYNTQTREVCTQNFPDVPIFRVTLSHGHTLNHDEVRQIIERKLKEY